MRENVFFFQIIKLAKTFFKYLDKSNRAYCHARQINTRAILPWIKFLFKK